MIIVLILSALIFISYNWVNISLFGIPTSLSNTYYLLKEQYGKPKIWFSITLISMSMSLFPAFMTLPGTETLVSSLLKWICLGSLGFVGMAPLFKGIDKVRHFIFAGICAFTGLLWILFCTPFWYIPIIVACILFIISEATNTFKCWMYWVEMVMFISIYIINFIYLI